MSENAVEHVTYMTDTNALDDSETHLHFQNATQHDILSAGGLYKVFIVIK